MLRNDYQLDITEELLHILTQFSFKKAQGIELKMYREISPDSFVWELEIKGEVYYLYAEDYVPSIKHVEDVIKSFAVNVAGHFIEVRKPKKFEEMEPVKSATTYLKPKFYDEKLAKYATDSGFDNILLYKIDSFQNAT